MSVESFSELLYKYEYIRSGDRRLLVGRMVRLRTARIAHIFSQ